MRHLNVFERLETQLQGLSAAYNGNPVSTLSVVRLAFWNAGRETIRGEDSPPKDPIRLIVRAPARILDCKILHETSAANEFSLNRNAEAAEVRLAYNYVDKDDGVVVQVIHTGASLEDVQFLGIVKGFGPPKRMRIPAPRSATAKGGAMSLRARRLMFGWLLALVPVLVGANAAWKLYTEAPRPGLVDLLLLPALAALLYWPFAFILLRPRLPPGLRRFEDDAYT